MNTQSEQVKKYFDSLAGNYSQRYSSTHPYHSYFFNKRLFLATQHYDFEGKTILDIGAGTGALYDHLKKRGQKFQYFASDVSQKMLEQSQIPKDQRLVGSIEEISFPIKQFDYIFLLGVTTYQSEEELKKTLAFITNHSDSESRTIITFTNQNSIDFISRKWLKKIMNLFSKKNSLISQSFSTSTFSNSHLEDLLADQFQITNSIWFNFTLTPFNHFFPKLSVKFSKFLDSKLSSSKFRDRLGSDIILFLKKK